MIDLSDQPSEDQIGAMLDHFSKYVDSEQHPVCPCEEFKTDIDDLCDNCLLKRYISTKVQRQISLITNIHKDILDRQSFVKDLHNQKEVALKTMDEAFFLELQNKRYPKDPQRVNRTLAFIWNKEAIKVFTSFLKAEDTVLAVESEEAKKAEGVPLRLSHPAIATLCHINGLIITRNNATEIAKKYGQSSGQRLETEFSNLTDIGVRTGKGKNRVKDYISIESLILPKYKSQYDKELDQTKKNNRK